MSDISLEKMDSFFTHRVEDYDQHMISNVEGCKEAYIKMGELVAAHTMGIAKPRLLDLGCGTGLELAEVFRLVPNIKLTGIDLTSAMLEKLRQKYEGRDMKLICGSYFEVDLGVSSFDCAISFQTMHHFVHEEKLGLYSRIYKALSQGGVYIECDYMVDKQAEEDLYFAENLRLRKEQNIPDGVFYHYDTPCTIENQKKLLLAAGFKQVEQVFRVENTTMLVAE